MTGIPETWIKLPDGAMMDLLTNEFFIPVLDGEGNLIWASSIFDHEKPDAFDRLGVEKHHARSCALPNQGMKIVTLP